MVLKEVIVCPIIIYMFLPIIFVGVGFVEHKEKKGTFMSDMEAFSSNLQVGWKNMEAQLKTQPSSILAAVPAMIVLIFCSVINSILVYPTITTIKTLILIFP